MSRSYWLALIALSFLFKEFAVEAVIDGIRIALCAMVYLSDDKTVAKMGPDIGGWGRYAPHPTVKTICISDKTNTNNKRPILQ